MQDIWKTKRIVEHIFIQGLDAFAFVIQSSAEQMANNFFKNMLLSLDSGINI